MAETNLKEWYEPTPADWSIQRMKNIMSPREEKSIDGKEELLSVTINEGIIKRSEYLDEDEGTSRADSLVGYKVVSPTNLVNNIMKMSFRCLGVSSHEGIVSPAYSVFELNHSKVDPTYLNFLLRIDLYIAEYRKLSKGIQESRMRLYDDFFLAMKVIVPPLNEQKFISRYLDKKTSQIDSLINKVEKKIELLKEQRTSLINQYVTKGIDPNVEMKDSGVELIGEIPKQWKLGKLKYLSTLITKGTTPSNIGENYDDNGEVRFLKGEDLLDGQVIDSGKTFISSEVNEKLKRSKLAKGDLLVVIAGTLGKCAVVHESVLPANTNQAISLIRFKEGVNPEFFRYWFETSSCKNQISEFAVVAAQPNLSMEDLGSIIVPILESAEQNEIERLVSQKAMIINKKISNQIRRIDLLKEFRQSLISSAVTGKVRVTEEML